MNFHFRGGHRPLLKGHRPPRTKLNGIGGFTLVELIVVVTLTAIALGLAPLYFSKMLPSAKLNATAREISSTLRVARSMAIFTGKPQTVTIELDEMLYGLEGKGKKQIPEGMVFKVEDPVYGEIKNGNWQITFRSSGTARGGTIVLSSGQKTLGIKIDPVVGSFMVVDR